MRRVLLVLALLGLTLGANVDSIKADQTDLSNGVLITHAPANFVYSAGMDWVSEYDATYAITSCAEQVNTMPITGAATSPTLFYVIDAWQEDKLFCATEFGISADFDGQFYFTEYGTCHPSALENSTGGWPGAGEGTAVVAAGIQFTGNYVPAYYFLGYAYYDSKIQLDVDPAQDFGGFGNCAIPAQVWDATCFGAVGIGAESGNYCCPGGTVDPEAVCCTDGACTIVTEAVCTAGGGTWFEELTECDPNPCPEEYACCIGTICNVRPEDECLGLGGTWHWGFYCSGGDPAYNCAAIGEMHPCCLAGGECVMDYEQDCLGPQYDGGDFYESWDNCEQNPCATPANSATWGSIKTIYR